MKRLTNAHDSADSLRALAALPDARGEWFCAEQPGGVSVPLRKGEWELSAAHGRVHFAYWTERGLRTWRLLAWGWQDERLRLDATRRMGAERATLELVPRASVRAGIEAVHAARVHLCMQLAQLVCANLNDAQIERVRLSAGARRSEPGRYARIIVRAGRELLAVTGPVVALGAHAADALLAATLLWWLRLNRQPRLAALRRLLLVVPRELSAATAERLALLRAELRRDIALF
ncbi:MAG TPA: hypothetical protein VE775_04800, partial [Pyrinomonadaceae bacterium]|nr:hypothetical protein [Pyrinomonadaceae bacterium]